MQHVEEGFLSHIGGLTNAFLCAAMPKGAFLCSGLAVMLPVSAVLARCCCWSMGRWAGGRSIGNCRKGRRGCISL
jgi:hypothetical protein